MLSYGYNSFGWLTSATLSGSVNLVTNITYNGIGGAASMPTGASVAGGAYTFAASYDNDLRPLTSSMTHSGTTVFASSRGYDPVGDVTSVNTTLAAGTDNQAFCYDDLGRLIWAGSTGTPSCGASLTPGNLTAAQYTQTFSYDTLDRLTSGPLGTYTYGPGMQASSNPSPLDAALSIGTGGTPTYTASYDTAGDMTCRAPTSATTCAGTPTGAALTYNNERWLTHWQNAQSNPTATDDFRYDGEGKRIAQSSNGVTTYYLNGLEEVTNGVITKYYPIPGVLIAMRIGGTLSYMAADGLSSVTEALDGSGNVTAAQLYTPYGTTRYSSGTMPTAKGFTGQYGDAASGLDYYNARYYDPLAGQFASADDVLGPNRFGYVADNPETYNDPTGHILGCGADIMQLAVLGGGSLAETLGTCTGETALGLRAAKQAVAAAKIYNMAVKTYKSGNPVYLTSTGANDLDALMSRGTLVKAALSGLKNPGSAIGFGDEPANYVVKTIQGVIDTTGDARTTGIGGGASRIGELQQGVDDAANTIEHGKLWGKVLGIGGILVTGLVAGISDYSQHQSIPGRHGWAACIWVYRALVRG